MALLDPDIFNSPISVSKAVSVQNKRKSMGVSIDSCKKRLLDKLNMHDKAETDASSTTDLWPCDTEIFETQFFHQVDQATAASSVAKSAPSDASELRSKSPPPVDNLTNLSQFFEDTQFTQFARPTNLSTIERTVQPVNTEVQIDKNEPQPAKGDIPKRSLADDIPKRPLPPSTQAYNLTQYFCDDVDEEEINFSGATSTLSSFPQSSQIFIEAVRTAAIPETHNSCKHDESFQKIYKSSITAAAYIEMQRDMHDANENNLNDDNCVDPELSQAYKSTQYRDELQQVFNNYENKVCTGLEMLIDDDWTLIPEAYINPDQEKAVASNGQPENVAYAVGVDWETPFSDTPVKEKPKSAPFMTPTALVQQRLCYRKSLASSTTPPVSRTSSFDNPAPGEFVPLGPFFGLPETVKTLIRDYKGISNLYGRIKSTHSRILIIFA